MENIFLEKHNDKNIILDMFGLNLEFNPIKIFKGIISEETEDFLNEYLKKYLNDILLPEFKNIETYINSDRFSIETFREVQNSHIYKYSCLWRDLGYICSDIIQDFEKENENTMYIINNIIKYNKLYGYKESNKIEIK